MYYIKEMMENNNSPTHLSLYQLNNLVSEVISLSFNQDFWVEAEVSEIREVRGHCYIELIEKDEKMNTPIARASAKCWSNKWMFIKPHFERVTRQQLKAGMKVLLKVEAQFHEAFGFAWIINDIDPTFTLGSMAKKRKDIIDALKAQGVYDLQKELYMPLFAKRIAVISSEGAAGYGDFMQHLVHNEYGFVFEVTLFNAVMQGEGIEQSVISALNAINDKLSQFDVVVMIRGGGGTSDLSGFDSLALAENIANFPIPVITGIGHDRDESVLDLISFEQVKTPTAAADYFINHALRVYSRIDTLQQYVVTYAQNRIELERNKLQRLAEKVPIVFSVVKTKQEGYIQQLLQRLAIGMQSAISHQQRTVEMLAQRLNNAPKYILNSEQHRLTLLNEKIKSLDPQRILERGYSITLHNGKSVLNAKELKKGDEIKTQFKDGIITSIIK